MAYNSSYETSDLTEVTISGLAVFLIALIGFAGIIALVMVYKWARKNVK